MRILVVLVFCAGCAAVGPSVPEVPASAVIARLGVGAAPTMLAVSPDGRRVYAASNGSISIIDGATNRVLRTIDAKPNAAGIAVAPNGAKVYVTHLFSVDLTVIDAATEALAPSFTMLLQRLRGGFGRLAVAPDNHTIYLSNKANQALGIVDVAVGTSSSLSPTVWPIDVAVSPDGRTVYGAGCKQICTPGFVQLFDVPTQRFTDEIEVDGSPYRIVLSRRGDHAYVAHLAGPSVSYVDLAARRVTTTVAVPPQPTGLGISPDGSTLYVASQTAGTLSVLDVPTPAVRSELRIAQARDVAVSADGRHIYVSSGSEVLVVDATKL